MTPLLEIFIIIAIVVFIFLAVGFFVKVNKTLDKVQTNLDELTGSINKVVIELAEVKTQAVSTLQTIEKSVDEFAVVSKNIQGRFDDLAKTFEPIKSLVNTVHERVGPPVIQMAGIVTAASKAVNAFMERLSR
jgi:ABC-type transporter Mla subunit MlaD